MGAVILNPGELVAAASPVEAKEMVAPVTALVLKAVKPAKVTVPETAAFVVVPPRVQVFWTAVAVTLALLLVTALPYKSCNTNTG